MRGKIKLAGPETLALACLGAAWSAGLLTILTHSIFVTNDSLSNYAHVWYVSREFWAGNGVPFHFPEIGHGDALAFPYGFLPWFSAALLRPLFGDWVVTLWLVAGFVGFAAATWWAFPELRSAPALALMLANPMLVEAVILSQLPFLWATALLAAAIGCWRRGRTSGAVVLMAASQATHPAVLIPLAGLLVASWMIFERKRRSLVVCYGVSLALAAPAAALVFASPVVEDSTTAALLGNFIGTVGLRAGVVFAPFVALLLRPLLGKSTVALAAVALLVASNVALVPLRDTGYAWHAFTRSPDETLRSFLESDRFERGATYRLLRVADGKVGMYQLIQQGGRLDSEFFPESIHRTSWPEAQAYVDFLEGRHVDYVLIYQAYDERYRTNEHALLEQLTAQGCVVLAERNEQFDLYLTRGAGDSCAPGD